MPKNSSGFAAITIMLVMILVIIAAGGIYYFANQNVKNSTPTQTAQSTNASPNEVPAELPSSTPIPIISTSDDPKLTQLKNEILNAVDEKIATTSADLNQPQEYFVYFGANGSTQSTAWTDMSGSDIKFNTASYPGAKTFYFEADLQTDAPDRTGYARIYDVTDSAGVGGSDINYSGLTPNYEISSPLSFSAGNLQLRVQIHSELNVTTIYNPRIKIVY